MIAKLVFHPANKDGFPHYKSGNTIRSILDGTPIVFSELVEKNTYIALDKQGNIVAQGVLVEEKEQNK